MALLASPEGEGAQLPGSSGSSQSFACHPPPPYPSLPCSPPPSLQKPPITQPFSEVIWGSLEREELPLRVHLGRQKGLELYSVGRIANKAKPCEWRQSLFSVVWVILLGCMKKGEKVRWRETQGRNLVFVGCRCQGGRRRDCFETWEKIVHLRTGLSHFFKESDWSL